MTKRSHGGEGAPNLRPHLRPNLQIVEATSPSQDGADAAPSDDELVARAAGGEQGAFAILVRRHQGQVLGFATRFFGQPALAADLGQEVFLDLLRALPRYRPEGRFPLYLYKLTLNRCRMAARSYRYEDRNRERLWVERESQAALPPDEVAARERERRLQRALLAVPEKHRAVLQLRFWGGLSHAEIAVVLETNEGTIKSRLFNGLAMLRKQLQEVES